MLPGGQLRAMERGTPSPQPAHQGLRKVEARMAYGLAIGLLGSTRILIIMY